QPRCGRLREYHAARRHQRGAAIARVRSDRRPEAGGAAHRGRNARRRRRTAGVLGARSSIGRYSRVLQQVFGKTTFHARSCVMKKVGLLCGREFSFPPAFIAKVNQLGKNEGVTAEFVKLAGTKMNEPAGYSVIVDRISHEVEYYRGYLKH